MILAGRDKRVCEPHKSNCKKFVTELINGKFEYPSQTWCQKYFYALVINEFNIIKHKFKKISEK